MRMNDYYRRKFTAEVKKFVASEYEKSAFGQEFKEINDEVFFQVQEAALRLFPYNHIQILDSYGFTERLHHFRLTLDSDTGQFRYDDPYQETPGDFIQEPGILVPKGKKTAAVNEFISGAPAQDLEHYFQVSERYRCEVSSIISSYKNILNNSTTLKSLIAKSPIFEKLAKLIKSSEISSEIVEMPKPVDESLVAVKSFEQSLIKE